MINPSKIALAPFLLCVKLLEFLGRRFNLTYKEISVVVNLWIQGFVLMASGILPLAKGIIVGQPVLSIVCWGFYAFIYVVGFLWILWHYHLPFERAFDLCVADLMWLADKCRLSYHAINLIIFVGIFLLLIVVNVLWSLSI